MRSECFGFGMLLIIPVIACGVWDSWALFLFVVDGIMSILICSYHAVLDKQRPANNIFVYIRAHTSAEVDFAK